MDYNVVHGLGEVSGSELGSGIGLVATQGDGHLPAAVASKAGLAGTCWPLTPTLLQGADRH